MQNITVVTIKVCTTGNSFFVISGSTTDSKKIYVVVTCILHHSFIIIIIIIIILFLDSLLSDNIACSRRSYCKTKCTVNGTIVTAEPKRKSEAWVESSKERRSPDPTQPDPTQPHSSPFFHSIAAIVQCTICSVLLNKRLEKVSDNNSN